MRLWTLAIGLIATVAGCLDVKPVTEGSTSAGPHAGPVVIALLDTGITPYWPIYDVADAAPYLAAVPLNAVPIQLSQSGSVGERLDADWPMWKTLDPHVLYHVEGTRLFSISFDESKEYPTIHDADFHGGATSYLAAREAPGAVILMVEVSVSECFGTTECRVHPSLAQGMEWIAAQDWIDVVSVSMGVPVDTFPIKNEAGRYLAPSREAARSGKIVVNGAGNTPPPWMSDYFSGPPWIVRVGGVDSGAQGMSIYSSNVVDVVANYSDLAPFRQESELQYRSGTSFATPIVAGTLAHALHLLREAAPERAVTTQELRDALNASATYFAPTDWKPGPPGRDPLPWDATQYATLPVLAEAQMGWGYVDSSLAPEIARRILEQDFTIPAEKDQAMALQPAWQQAREEFWARYP